MALKLTELMSMFTSRPSVILEWDRSRAYLACFVIIASRNSPTQQSTIYCRTSLRHQVERILVIRYNLPADFTLVIVLT